MNKLASTQEKAQIIAANDIGRQKQADDEARSKVNAIFKQFKDLQKFYAYHEYIGERTCDTFSMDLTHRVIIGKVREDGSVDIESFGGQRNECPVSKLPTDIDFIIKPDLGSKELHLRREDNENINFLGWYTGIGVTAMLAFKVQKITRLALTYLREGVSESNAAYIRSAVEKANRYYSHVHHAATHQQHPSFFSWVGIC